jgi:hypothetical protein
VVRRVGDPARAFLRDRRTCWTMRRRVTVDAPTLGDIPGCGLPALRALKANRTFPTDELGTNRPCVHGLVRMERGKRRRGAKWHGLGAD